MKSSLVNIYIKSFVVSSLLIVFSCKEDQKNQKDSPQENTSQKDIGNNKIYDFFSNYKIKGTARGFEDNNWLYLYQMNQFNKTVLLDSSKIENNQFSFEKLRQVSETDFQLISPTKRIDQTNHILFLSEANEVNISFHKDSIRNAKITGKRENNSFAEHLKMIRNYSDSINHYNLQIYSNRANQQVDMLKKNQVKLASLQQRFGFHISNAVTSRPDAVSTIITLMDAAQTKILPTPTIIKYYHKLEDNVKNTRLGKALGNAVKTAEEQIKYRAGIPKGDKAPDFTAKTPEGKEISLYKDILPKTNKYLILDFWASWCKPCRMENPALVELYHKYHDKGLDMVGLSLDRDTTQWQRAIKNDNLEWLQISNLAHWQEPAVRAYRTQSIPATFVLDKEGTVVASGLRGIDLEATIEDLLSK